ncbi:helix-turn-helix domain-containing protein [Pseudonocardia sp. NPDC049635]|uniref:helix-turn-helix domain-containing protein n=1 Tax=Pseudonocardia sp. NPDC049635 TaxID=3155506 RepID=UPI0033F72286
MTEEEAARLMGSVEAAKAVGVDRTTLARWVAAGKIEPTLTTAGGHHRYDLDDLRRQLAALRDARRGSTE